MNQINYSSHYSGKFRNSNKIIRIFFLQHLRTTFEFLNLSFLLILYFISTRTRLRATKFRFTTNTYTHAIRGRRCTLSLFQCARRNAFLFPPSIAQPSEYFKKSCTFNYTVIQMASFTWYFFARVGRIRNSMGVSPFVFIGRGKNREFTRERVFFFFFLFLCLLLLRAISLAFSPLPSSFSFSFASSIHLVRYKVKFVYWELAYNKKWIDETEYFFFFLIFERWVCKNTLCWNYFEKNFLLSFYLA